MLLCFLKNSIIFSSDRLMIQSNLLKWYLFSALRNMFLSAAFPRAIQVADGPHRENGSGVNWRTLHCTISPRADRLHTDQWPNPSSIPCSRKLNCAIFLANTRLGTANATPCIVGSTWLQHSVSNSLSTGWPVNHNAFSSSAICLIPALPSHLHLYQVSLQPFYTEMYLASHGNNNRWWWFSQHT